MASTSQVLAVLAGAVLAGAVLAGWRRLVLGETLAASGGRQSSEAIGGASEACGDRWSPKLGRDRWHVISVRDR